VPVSIKRRTGILLQFATETPQGFVGCHARLRAGDGKELPSSGNTIGAGGCWFFELWRAPAGPYQVQVMRGIKKPSPGPT